MADDAARAATEAEHGIWRLLRHPFDETHKELYGEDVAVSEETAPEVVRRLKQDPELAPAFKRPKPKWEDLKTRKDKSEFVDEYGVDAFLDLARRAHLK
jgi:hypothetical protein